MGNHRNVLGNTLRSIRKPEVVGRRLTGSVNADCSLDSRKLGGKAAPPGFAGSLPGVSGYSVGGERNVSVTVNNVLVDTKIYNVFGVIKGYVDPGEELELLHTKLTSGSLFNGNSVC